MYSGCPAARGAHQRGTVTATPPVTRGADPRVHPLRDTRRNASPRDGLPLPAMTVGGALSSIFCRVLVLSALVAGQNSLGDETRVLPDRGLDFRGNIGISPEKRLGVFAALTDALTVVGEPGA